MCQLAVRFLRSRLAPSPPESAGRPVSSTRHRDVQLHRSGLRGIKGCNAKRPLIAPCKARRRSTNAAAAANAGRGSR